MAKRRVPDQVVLNQIPAARERAKRSRQRQPHADSAKYDARKKRLHITLTNGGAFALPVAMIEELRGPDAVIEQVEVGPAGVGLHWEALDTDLSVARLAELVLGRTALLKAAGATGGAVRSKAKTEAARVNGSKGGRPRKSKA